MSILWQRGSGTVREVLEAMPTAVAYTTVMTMMVRLYERDVLTREREGRGFRYRPQKNRDEFISELAGSLLGRLVADFGDIAWRGSSRQPTSSTRAARPTYESASPMPNRPSHDLALLGSLVMAGVGMPVAVFLIVGAAATWQAGLAVIGAFAACSTLVTLALAAPAPAVIAVALLAVSATRGLGSASRQLLHPRRSVHPLLALARTSPRLAAACARAGVDPRSSSR